MGGVRPRWRNKGVAECLLHEAWRPGRVRKATKRCASNTLNRHRNMLHFAIKQGFNIIRLTEYEAVDEHPDLAGEKKLK
ncbi:MAG: hypothetical protein R3B47_14095 [Bacteroidia bacterium]